MTLALAAVSVACSPVQAARAGQPGGASETFTTQAFSIVPENLVEITQIVPHPGGRLTLALTLPHCTNARVHGKTIRTITVASAPPGELHRGEIVATGLAERDGTSFAALRKVGPQELKTYHC